MYEGPGIYQHYKGGFYRVLGVAEHESTGAKTVIYYSYSVEQDILRAIHGVNFVARPLNEEDGEDAWNTCVDGNRPRFVKLLIEPRRYREHR